MKNHSKEWRWQLVVLARNSKLLEWIVKEIGPVSRWDFFAKKDIPFYSIFCVITSCILKSSSSEKATNIWNNLPLVLMLLSKNSCFVETGGRFFFKFCDLLMMSKLYKQKFCKLSFHRNSDLLCENWESTFDLK